MSKGDVTLKDIAKAVDKSVATISKALHDHDDIALETRQAVKQVAQEMGYQPNITAQRLQKQRTDTLGLILPVLASRQADPFLTELLSGLADQAAEHGFDLLVSAYAPGPAEEAAYQRLVHQRRVDGLIVTQPRLKDWRIEFLTTQKIPFVAVGQFNPLADIPGVWIDVIYGLTVAVKHLLVQGRRRLALIPPPMDFLMQEVYQQAFAQIVAEHDALWEQSALEITALEHNEGYRAAQTLLSEADGPEAIIACHDLLALGALAAAQDQGFEIGNDIAIIGFGDIPLSEHAHPPLTTVHQPTYLMAQRACEILIALIDGTDGRDGSRKTLSQAQDIIEPWLVVRQSSDLSLWV